MTGNIHRDPVLWSDTRYVCGATEPTPEEIFAYITGVADPLTPDARTRIVSVTRPFPGAPAVSPRTQRVCGFRVMGGELVTWRR